MRQSSKPFPGLAIVTRAFCAALAGLALISATCVHAGQTVIWTPTSSGAWDTTSANWTTTTGSNAMFAFGDAAVFGLNASGSATNVNGHVMITAGGVVVGPEAYANIASGTNPGVIIGSGSWLFTGGTIGGGSFAVTGSSAIEFGGMDTSGTTGYYRQYVNQRIDAADNASLKLLVSYNNGSIFTGTVTGTVSGGAIHSGSNSNLTLGAASSLGALFFYTNTTTQQGGAVYAGANLDAQGATSGTYNWFRFIFQSNNAGQQGGAIYSAGNVTMVAPDTGTTSILSAEFINNKSGAEGGAIYAQGNVVLSGSMSFVSNTAATAGGAIYSKGDVSITQLANFSNNSSGTAGGAIYTEGNLSVSGTGSIVTFAGNKVGGDTAHASSLAYVGGTFSVSGTSALITDGGGISARQINFSDSTLAITQSAQTNTGKLTLTTIDASGNAVAAPGQITFNNVTLTTGQGELAVNPGSNIAITGTLTANMATASAAEGSMKISADLTGSGELLKVGVGAVTLSGSNSYTGPTTVAQGRLIGNIVDSSTLNVLMGGVYVGGTLVNTGSTYIYQGVDRNVASLNGSGLVDMSGATLNITAGDFSSGTMTNTGLVNKVGPNDTFTIGTGTVANVTIGAGALNFGGISPLNVTGTTFVATSGTLGVNVSDTFGLHTNYLASTTGTATINIAGYGDITNYTNTGTHTLVVVDQGVAANSYTLAVHGVDITSAPPDDNEFLRFSDASTGTAIVVKSSLVWTNTAAGSAHGTFNVDSGVFTLGAGLADNTTPGAGFNGWDGKSLTKKGDGTLILAGTNTYTGTTTVQDGLLINNGVIGTGPVLVQPTGIAINHGVIGGDVTNNGLFVFETYTVSSTFTGTTFGTTVPASTSTATPNANGGQTITTVTYSSVSGTGSESYYTSTTIAAKETNGRLDRNLVNTGTAALNMSLDYTWSGTLGGNAGIIYKTGTAAFTHTGVSTYSGTLEVDQGAYISGRAHNLDSVAQFNIVNTSGTLSFGGFDQSVKRIDNNGVLMMGPAPAAGMTFVSATIGTLTGTSGLGRIIVRSDYNSGKADRITITAAASGTHAITALNVDNNTPSKVSPSIPLIIGAGTTMDVAFTGTTDVGMGRLIIHRGDGGLLSPDPEVWYLAATDQSSNVADAILSTASVAGMEWHYQLDSVRQRMGDLRQEALMAPPSKRQSPLAYTNVSSKGGNAWIRGNAYHVDADEQITTAAFTEDVGGISFGYDKTYRWEDNQYLLGAYGELSGVRRDFGSRGDGKTNDYGIGFYFSYLKDNGWYGDTTLLITKNKNSFNAHPIDRPDETISGDYSTVSWGISQEIGKVIKNKRSGWWVEPSVQAEFAVLNGQTYNTSAGMEVKMADANVTQLRAALRAGRDIPNSHFKPYVRIAVATANTSGGQIRAGTVNPMYYTADMDGSRLEAGAGLSYVIDEKSQLYLDYEYAKASNYKRPWAFNFGYRRTW